MRFGMTAALVVLAGVSLLALGQAGGRAGGAGTLPAAGTQKIVPVAGLVIEDADAKAQGAVRVEAVGIVATIEGPLAQTVVTLTFKNTLNRVLEGELEFPLPEGAAVVGYGLDVPAGSGNVVEGVCVEKERARQIFESEERRGVDPGILEQTRGNNYRTRVHPIPANGTRTVQVTYVSEVGVAGGKSVYTLPLDFLGKVGKADIRVEVVGGGKGLAVAGLPGLGFAEVGGKMVTEKSLANVALSGALTVTADTAGAGDVMAVVENRVKVQTVANLLYVRNAEPAAESYFLISGTAPAAGTRGVLTEPEKINVIWDTSLSRANADHAAEFALLRAIFFPNSGSRFEVFDMKGDSIKVGTAGDVETLIGFLKDLPCDGALDLDALQEKFGGAVSASGKLPGSPVPTLFFTDGLVTLGKRDFHPTGMMLYTVSGDARADHGFLSQLAEQTGGMYLNLQRTTAQGAVSAVMGAPMVATLNWDLAKTQVTGIFPGPSRRVVAGERFTFAGQLMGEQTAITVTISRGASVIETQQITLSREGAASSGLVPRYWAQQKVAALSVDAVKNDAAIVALGKSFSLVTPRTSLLVLETADQYVRYGIVPPASRKDILAEFNAKIESQNVAAKKVEGEKIDHVLALWNTRVARWEKEFKAPTKEEVAAAMEKEKAQNAPAPGAAREMSGTYGGAGGGTGGAAASQASQNVAAGDAHVVLERRQVAGEPTTSPRRGGQLGGVDNDDIVGAGRDGQWGTDDDISNTNKDDKARATISIKAWNPDAPYLRAISGSPEAGWYAIYLAQRKDYFSAPSFYLDCANYFLEKGQREIGVKILTNIAQLKLEDAPLLRIAAYRLLQIGEYGLAIDLFEQAKALRPDEPQSWRDLALAHAARAIVEEGMKTRMGLALPAVNDFREALADYQHVIINQWERFDEIEVVALMEADALFAHIRRVDAPPGTPEAQREIVNPLDSRLVKNLDCDLRIVMTWDADNTDIDLHVIEPTGEEAYYAHNLTLSGGMVSKDFTQGYGPEEYVVRHALPGTYKIQANFFGTRQQTVQGAVTVQATLITNFGRANEKREALTVRVTEPKETVTLGEIVMK